MRGTNMSVVGCAVVKCFATCTTSESALRGSLVVCFQVTIESGFLCEAFLAAGTFVRFLHSMDSLVSFEVIQTSKGLVAFVTTVFLARLFGWGLPRTRLNILQLFLASLSVKLNYTISSYHTKKENKSKCLNRGKPAIVLISMLYLPFCINQSSLSQV